MPSYTFTALELVLMGAFLSLFVNVITRTWCARKYVQQSEIKKLNTKIDILFKTMRALVVQTIDDKNKQQEILNITGDKNV